MTPAGDFVQVAALPLTIGEDGVTRVLLLTSRETRRWVIPKGWPMKGCKPYEAAAQEALEEAGVTGQAKKSRSEPTPISNGARRISMSAGSMSIFWW